MKLNLNQALELLALFEHPQAEAWDRGIAAETSEERLMWWSLASYHGYLTLLGQLPTIEAESRAATPAQLRDVALSVMLPF